MNEVCLRTAIALVLDWTLMPHALVSKQDALDLCIAWLGHQAVSGQLGLAPKHKVRL